MNRIILTYLIIQFLVGWTFAQPNDCDMAECLQSNAPVQGSVFAPGGNDPVTGCLQFGENQVHWYVFEATSAGTFEMLITPDGLGADYDFAIYQGGCPDAGGSLLVCNWEGPINPGPYFTTGIATDPVGSFGANANPMNPNPQDEWEPTTSLVPGEVYYLILDNITANGVGFSIQFAGTAGIGSPAPPNTPPGPITGPTEVCEGDTETYTVPPVSGATLTWTGPNDALLVPNGNEVTVTWGSTTGDLCVTAEACDMMGPPGCITVQVNPQPNVSVTPPGPVCDTEFDLSTLMIIGLDPTWTVSYHNSQGAAENGFPALPSPIVNQSGTYWIRVESGPGCYAVTQVNITLEQPDISAELDPNAIFCEPDEVDLSAWVTVTELTGINPNSLTITFHFSQPDAVNGFPAIIPPLVNQSGIYWVRAETPSGCFDVDFVEITIDPQPVISVVQPDPVCTPPLELNLNDVQIIVTNGNPNDVDFVFYTTFNDAQAGVNPLFTPFVTQSGTYYVVGVSPNGCTSEPQPIEVIIGGEVIATLSGADDLCAGDNAELMIDFTGGVPPFEVVVEDDQGNQYVINTNNNPHTELIPIDESTTFTIVDFTDSGAGDCPTTFDGTAVFTVADIPEANLTGNTAICCGDTAFLEFFLTGAGPFTVEYEDDVSGNTFNLTGISDGHLEPVTPCENTNYTLINVTDANGCAGNVDGLAEVTMHETPMVTNLVELPCIQLQYSIQFEITGGSGTYTVLGDPGTLSGDVFTSDPIDGGEPYTFLVFDENACDTLMLADTVECNCGTFAGTMSSTPIDLCEGDLASATHNGNQFLEMDDTLQFVLHTNSGGILGMILETGNAPEFGFDPVTMSFDTTYYISSIAGNDDGTGNVDLADPCLDVSPGTPVIWHEIPDAVLSGGNPVCPGELMDFQLDFTGTGPFTVVYQIGGVTDSIVTTDNPHTFSVLVSVVGTIDLVNVSTSFCDQNLTASLPIDVFDSPVVSPPSYECNSTNTAYTVSFTISGGSGNYQVLGGSGNLTGADFMSDEIPSGTPELFQVVDGNACDTINVPVQFNCDCGTLTGTVNQVQEELCADDLVTVQDLGGAMLDGNDVLEFILHDQSGTILGTVIDRNDTGEFGFDGSTMNLGQIYYISLVAGDNIGTGQVDLTDPCLSVSSGKPVRWHAYPIADIGGLDTLTCQITEITLDGSASTGSNNLMYNWSTPNGVINGSTTGVTAIAAAPGMYELLVIDQLAGCADSSSVEVVSDGSIPVVTIAPPDLLTCQITEVTLDASGSSSGPDIQIQWTTTNGNIVSGANSQMPVVDAPGTYTLTLTDVTNDCEASGSVSVDQDNAGITSVIAVTDILDCDTDQVVLDGSGSSSGPDITYTWSTTDGNLAGSTNGTTATATAAGTYYLLVEDQSSGCFAIDSADVQQNGLVPTDLDLTIIPISCFEETDGSIIINNVVGGEAPYQYSLNGGPFTNLPSFASLGEGDYTITVIDANGCQFITQVSLVEPEELEVTLGEDIFIQLGDSVQLEAQVNQPVDTFIWNGDIDRNQQGQQDPWVSPIITLQYTVTVITQGGCVDEDQQLVIVERERPLFIPNVFSPNNDGINDYFMIYGGDGAEEIVSLLVYSRWGEVIYEGRNLTPGDEPAGWDGMFKGEMMNPGVFIFTAEVLFEDGVTEFYKGDFSLLR